jgi:hypothetical protein
VYWNQENEKDALTYYFRPSKFREMNAKQLNDFTQSVDHGNVDRQFNYGQVNRSEQGSCVFCFECGISGRQ